MAGSTPFLGLYLPGGGSTGVYLPDEVADIDPLNQDFLTIDTHVGALEAFQGAQVTRNQQYRGLTAGIGAVVGMYEGDTYKETDLLKRTWIYDGTNWVTNENGYFRVRPNAVTGTGATLDANGVVVLANTTGTVTLLDIFSSRFDHYILNIDIDAAAGDSGGLFALRTAAGALSTQYYGTYTEQAVSIGPTKVDISNGTTFGFGRYATNGGGATLEIIRPSKTTGLTKQFLVRSIDGASYHRVGGGYVSNSPAVPVTGIDIAFPVNVIAGRIHIFGLL